MWETWVQSLGWEDPLEKRKIIHSSILAWRIHGLYSSWGHKESDTTEWLNWTDDTIALKLTSSADKESTSNAGDPGSTPGLGRSPGEGIGYQLQYSWASLVAQLVKNPPAMRETWIQSLGWEDSLEKGKATQPSILAWRILWTEEACGLQSMGSQRVSQDWRDSTHAQKMATKPRAEDWFRN